MMLESYPVIAHEYDLWHIVKSLKKRLTKSKNPELMPWVQHICNHPWYCATACQGDIELLKEMWLSILHHITNEHSWATDPKFQPCAHKPYSRQEQKSRRWLKKGSKTFRLLQDAILDKKLLRDLTKVR